MSGYTKGPWKLFPITRFGQLSRTIQSGDGRINIGMVYISQSENTGEGNARLMAAAPELLQMLKTVRRTLLEAGGDPMPTMDALIAKAESL